MNRKDKLIYSYQSKIPHHVAVALAILWGFILAVLLIAITVFAISIQEWWPILIALILLIGGLIPIALLNSTEIWIKDGQLIIKETVFTLSPPSPLPMEDVSKIIIDPQPGPIKTKVFIAAVLHNGKKKVICEATTPEMAVKIRKAISNELPTMREIAHVRQLMKQKRYPEAASELNRIIRSNPENLMAYHARAALFHRQGELDKALRDYDHILRYDPDNDLMHLYRCKVHYQLGDWYLALDDLERYIQLSPLDTSTEIENLRKDLKQKLGYRN